METAQNNSFCDLARSLLYMTHDNESQNARQARGGVWRNDSLRVSSVNLSVRVTMKKGDKILIACAVYTVLVMFAVMVQIVLVMW